MQNLHYASKDSEPRLKIDVRIECRLGSDYYVMSGLRSSGYISAFSQIR